MFEKEKSETHPSYAMVGISHTSSTGTYLVGSEFKHQHFVTLSIKRAEKHRDLSREWWLGREEYIEVWLSEAQFVELMGRPNMGDGVPCTLAHLHGKSIEPPPPPKPLNANYRKDMKNDIDTCLKDLREAHKELVDAIESGKTGKTVLKEIAKKIEYAGYAVSRGIPFVEKSFSGAMENTLHHAAAEIEATVTNMAMRIGVEQMRLDAVQSAPKLIEEGDKRE